MNRTIKTSKDGSHTIFNENINECYHSDFGALTESMHIFIENGLRVSAAMPVYILEIGFGTGLNALLSLVEAHKAQKKIIYHTLELYPVELELIEKLNYPEIIDENFKDLFLKMHSCEWEKRVEISPFFSILKMKKDLVVFEPKHFYDVVYFDAFSPEKQPELWTLEIFRSIYDNLNPKAVLTTYCAKGIVKRSLATAGFKVERLPGPPGKRHILRASK